MNGSASLTVLGFQALITVLLALVNLALWRNQHRSYFLTWATAWALYALRLACISAYLLTNQIGWLLAHQLATGGTALLLLWAALQYSQGKLTRWQPVALAIAGLLWIGVSVVGVHSFAAGGLLSASALSAVTLWTGWVFWRHRRPGSTSATVLAATFGLWGLHHLDYPLLRPLGSGALYGALVDVVFIVTAAAAMLFLVLSEGREALAQRRAQLEQLTQLLLQAQEDERKRLARELHDEAGQILTAVKIELDLEGRTQAASLVEQALQRIRSLSYRLRPAELDDYGLLPALRTLVDDFRRRSRIDARLEVPELLPSYPAGLQVTLYRVVQEALTNVARHARARSVSVQLRAESGQVRLRVSDDGAGASIVPAPSLGLLGMRERISAMSGTLRITTAAGAGFCLDAVIPTPELDA